MEYSEAIGFGIGIVVITSMVVIYDLWRIYTIRRDIPLLGKLDNGGFAWQTNLEHEVVRDIPGVITMGVMMALPWFLSSESGTSTWLVVLFDVLLFLHVIGMLLPKRYAITKTHLFVDGHILPWSALKMSTRKSKNRIILQRKGWWIFAPLSLGGTLVDLSLARALIIDISHNSADE